MAEQNPMAIQMMFQDGLRLDIKKDELGKFFLNFLDPQSQSHSIQMSSDDLSKLGRILALCGVISQSQARPE
jgi:hypothetical protein